MVERTALRTDTGYFVPNYTDPEGKFLLQMAIGAGIGGFLGGAMDAYNQWAYTGTVDWSQVGWSALKGAAFGAVGGGIWRAASVWTGAWGAAARYGYLGMLGVGGGFAVTSGVELGLNINDYGLYDRRTGYASVQTMLGVAGTFLGFKYTPQGQCSLVLCGDQCDSDTR